MHIRGILGQYGSIVLGKYGTLAVWQYGSMVILQYGSMVQGKYGTLAVWKYGSMGPGEGLMMDLNMAPPQIEPAAGSVGDIWKWTTRFPQREIAPVKQSQTNPS